MEDFCPNNAVFCKLCDFVHWVDRKDGKYVATHPYYIAPPDCPNSGKAYEVDFPVVGQVFAEKELPSEFAADWIVKSFEERNR